MVVQEVVQEAAREVAQEAAQEAAREVAHCLVHCRPALAHRFLSPQILLYPDTQTIAEDSSLLLFALLF